MADRVAALLAVPPIVEDPLPGTARAYAEAKARDLMVGEDPVELAFA